MIRVGPRLIVATAFAVGSCKHADERLTPQPKIELIKVASIRDTFPFEAGMEEVSRDAHGRIYVGPTHDAAVVAFDSVGTPIRRIGRKGSGPGEFTWIPRP